MSILVFLDADNTLWDTDRVYRDAQEWLLGAVAERVGRRAVTANPIGFVRAVDQELAHRHHAGLRYPARLLARALALMLQGATVEGAAKRVWSDAAAGLADDIAAELEAEFGRRLSVTPALRPGVAEALALLRRAAVSTVVLTEASRARVLRTLAAHKLDGQVSKVIEARKDARLFRRVRHLAGPERAYMIGDQLDRDIAPAKAAGLVTVYFPGGFTPRWTPEVDAIGPDYTVVDLREAVQIVVDHRGPSPSQ